MTSQTPHVHAVARLARYKFSETTGTVRELARLLVGEMETSRSGYQYCLHCKTLRVIDDPRIWCGIGQYCSECRHDYMLQSPEYQMAMFHAREQLHAMMLRMNDDDQMRVWEMIKSQAMKIQEN